MRITVKLYASLAEYLPPGAQANLAADLARDYVQSRVPDALDHFGIDTAGVDQMIRARIPGPRPLAGG